MLEWLIELGVDEASSEDPVCRYGPAPAPQAAPDLTPDPAHGPAYAPSDAPAAPAGARQGGAPAPAGTARGATPTARAPAGRPPVAAPEIRRAAEDPAEEQIRAARAAAGAAVSLDGLAAALAAFDGCALKRGARTTVFADGNPAARLMVIGEAPGREEDAAGRPFVGRSGQLLDLMLSAIGLSRRAEDPAQAVYITNVLPWRPPQNRDPSSDEIAMLTPFLHRHIALARPEVLLLMGRTAASTLLGTATGITRLRGTWAEVDGLPAMPTFHPAALLRNPLQKRPVWADLLAVAERMGLPAAPARPGP
ncbi:uracil-DNA glycosylase [Paroceanicella profunda]|uniref:Type-4 uracil-DNA glycosylase n=2 Tax=Paroceanicella profunda TaxID=2579971 RepID=A0A5B8FXA4_9RHOB|nr:uracil-DNA glycosylase [Paroceanicella profunda]